MKIVGDLRVKKNCMLSLEEIPRSLIAQLFIYRLLMFYKTETYQQSRCSSFAN